jgi:leucyl-tRNA synthetase
MNDVSAAENKNLPPEVKQLRAFSGTDPSNGKLVQVYFEKADYPLTLQDLKATAAASEEQVKAQFQKFVGKGLSPGITITMENAATDLFESSRSLVR